MSKTIFRQYIGVKPSSHSVKEFPVKIINSKITEFHFILGFAQEAYNSNGTGTGIFKSTWNNEYFGPRKVTQLKAANPNVKVIISIGGRDVKTPFNPSEEYIWVKEAIDSLKTIIKRYSDQNGNIIDGIDINYEHVLKTSNDTDNTRFANCLGQVITELKSDPDLHIDIVSIAPSENNQVHYHKLYWQNNENITWVNYQIYNQSQIVSTPKAFTDLYDNVAKQYHSEKVLPGFSADPVDITSNKISRETFIAGCTQILRTSSLAGIFLWNAQDSKTPLSGQHKEFFLEEILQELLTRF